ncbi:MAG: LapA family protein [Gammaproteobacteria bacterium]|nr:LapA family protein [Gammaproteobacteria bacterium]
MNKVVTLLFLFAVLLLALSFAVINAHSVQLNYYVGELNLPLSFLVISALIFGAFLGSVAMMRPLFGLRLEIARLRKLAKVNEKEINNLRSIPVKEP